MGKMVTQRVLTKIHICRKIYIFQKETFEMWAEYLLKYVYCSKIHLKYGQNSYTPCIS